MTADPHLSPLARHVLGSMFGRNQVLTFHNLENVASPEMQEVLDELVSGGVLVRETGLPDMPVHGMAERYRVSEGFDVEPYRREAAAKAFGGDAPSIRIFVKKS